MTATDATDSANHGTPFTASAAPSPTGADSTVEGQIAGFGDRALALILDTVFCILAFAVIGNWAAIRWGGATSSGFNLSGLPALVTISLTGLVCFVYYWILEGTLGATLGKAIVGIRVRRVDGAKADLRASLIRNLLRVVDGLAVYLVGWIIAAFSRLRQRLGDRVAGTVVIRAPGDRTIRYAGGIALAAASVAAIIAIISIRHAAAQTSVAPQAGSSPPAITSTAAQGDAPPPAGGDGLTLSTITWMSEAGGAPHSGPYTPGSHVFAKYEITGFAHGPQGQVKVAIRILAVDPTGLAMGDSIPSDVDATDPTSAPIYGHFDIQLPDYAPAGGYAAHLHVHDAIGGRDATFAPPFSVTAPPDAPASKLEMRDLGLSTTDGGQVLAHPVFHAGETVYFTGRAFGVQFRDANPDFHVDVLLLGPSGSTILGKTDWGKMIGAVNYRPATFFVPVDGTVTLPAKAAPGPYVIRLGLRDLVAQASLNADVAFDMQ
jgi:uncharacterized RDD family membrane protein YckC